MRVFAIADPHLSELSLTLDADRALGGGLRSGEVVDVVATYGSGGNASTRLAASGAVVVNVTGSDDRAIGPAGTVTVTPLVSCLR